MHWITQEMHAPLPVENPNYDREKIFERSNDFNFELFFEKPLANIQAKVGEEFKHIIPREAIADYDYEGYSLKAAMADGTEFPEWLFYNSFERTFLGNPPEKGEWKLTLTARDPHGSAISQEVMLLVK